MVAFAVIFYCKFEVVPPILPQAQDRAPVIAGPIGGPIAPQICATVVKSAIWAPPGDQVRLKRKPGRRESAFCGPAEVSGGPFWSQNRFQTGSTQTESLVASPLPPAPSVFVGRHLVGRRNALVLGWSRGCDNRSPFIVHRSSIVDRRPSVIGLRSEE